MTEHAAEFHGFLVIDKPAGLTSRDVVNRVQRWFPRRTRIGHAGTLDPLATGVLPIAVGAATRLIEYVQRWDKCYRASIHLGGRSSTDDADGTITPVNVQDPPERGAVERALSCFVGAIQQVPPAYSAAKVAGRRAYELARKGNDVDLSPRQVRIERIDILDYDYPRLDIEVRCGTGTYIRSLARDLGNQLGCGGYVERLQRLWVGSFKVEDALGLDTNKQSLREKLLPPEIALEALPHITLDEEVIRQLRHGNLVMTDAKVPACEVAVFDRHGQLSLVAVVDDQGKLRPDKVLPVSTVPGV